MTQLYFKKKCESDFSQLYTPGSWYNELYGCPILNLVVKFTILAIAIYYYTYGRCKKVDVGTVSFR